MPKVSCTCIVWRNVHFMFTCLKCPVLVLSGEMFISCSHAQSVLYLYCLEKCSFHVHMPKVPRTCIFSQSVVLVEWPLKRSYLWHCIHCLPFVGSYSRRQVLVMVCYSRRQVLVMVCYSGRQVLVMVCYSGRQVLVMVCYSGRQVLVPSTKCQCWFAAERRAAQRGGGGSGQTADVGAGVLRCTPLPPSAPVVQPPGRGRRLPATHARHLLPHLCLHWQVCVWKGFPVSFFFFFF